MSAFKAGFIHAAKKSIFVFLVVLALILLFSQMVIAGSPVELNVSGSVIYVVSGAPALVAPGLSLTGDNIDHVQVSITAGFAPGDYLGIQGEAGNGGISSGIAWSYNPSTGVMDLQNAVNAATYQSLLRRINYFNTSSTLAQTTRTIGFSIISSLYCAATGHYYEYVTSSQAWDPAKTAAAGRSYFGLQGYLATVTSQAENDFILGKLGGDAWIGAADNGHESEWYWVTGPEGAANTGNGTYFFKQTAASSTSVHLNTPVYNNNVGSGGNAIGGLYNNWANGQPDDYRDYDSVAENYAHFYKNDFNHTDGTWNDYPDDNNGGAGIVHGYVVEYGGMAGDPTLQLTGSVTVNVTHPLGVGGEVVQANKPTLLTPWLALVGVFIIGGTILVLNRRKRS